MNIRSFQSGDELAQLKVYNTAAGSLVKFKPASVIDLQRRTQAKDFDPSTRWYAIENGSVVGYCSYQANGRIGFPWCLPGYESAAEPLFAQALNTMKARGIGAAFTAYRNDWPIINDFFQNRGFRLAREIVNFVLAFENMPTPSAKLGSQVTPATVDDIPGIFALDPTVFRAKTAADLEHALWHNPYLSSNCVFVQRDKAGGAIIAAGIFIRNAEYADPRAVDSNMPCFRLGAFGSEGMTCKRIKGLFSIVTRPSTNVFSVGMDLLSHAATLLTDDDEIANYGAQVASDAKALFAFYQRVFERQGSFPVFERELTT